MTDAFPSTAQAWIEAQLELGELGRAEVNRHIMETYSLPLSIYYRGGWRGRHGEPDDVIAGFFADRLGRGAFFQQWLGSGLRLRVWLRNAFSFYMKEVLRGVRRDSRILTLAPEVDIGDNSSSVDQLMEQAFARSIVQRALRITRDECRRAEQMRHWEVFCLHFLEGKSYPEIANSEVTASQAAVLVRVVVRRFRAALRVQLIRDGVRIENLDGEIQALMRTESHV